MRILNKKMLARIQRLVAGNRLSCESVNRFLIDYLEGSLDERTRASFETHLHDCPNCERFLDQYRHTVSIVQSDTEIEISDDVVRRTAAFLKHHFDDDA
jgi:predicted anti-sigma-YlaC factor YlaD